MAFLAIPTIVVLYVLKVRGPERRVASLPLWPRHLADRRADQPFRRLQPSWLLVAQLAVAAALALALIRPGIDGAAGVGSTTVVLIDGSPSMTATDVAPSRFSAAVAHARRLAGQLGPGDRMAVAVLGEHPDLLAGPTADREALSGALDRARPGGVTTDLAEGVSVANALLARQEGGSIVVLSDGHATRPDAPIPVAAPLTYRSFGSSGDNLALDALGRAPSGDVYLRVANLGAAPRDALVEMRADGRLVDVVPVRVEANSTSEALWPRLPAGTSVLEAGLAAAGGTSAVDTFALDDRAWLVTEAPQARRVLVVTEGNGFLTRALGLVPGMEVTTVRPDAYEEVPADLYVFDGFVPPGPLPHPALLVGPPPGAGPVPAGPEVDPGALLPADPREPLLRHVSLADVHVQRAANPTVPDGWRSIVSAANGPLLLVRQDEPRTAVLTFDLHRSDLPLRPAFPILVRNLAAYLLPGGATAAVSPIGRPLTVGLRPATEAVEVTTPGGEAREVRGPFPVSFEATTKPGVYSVSERTDAGTLTRRVVAALADPDASRIAVGPAPTVRAVASGGFQAPRGVRELWPWLAVVALLVLSLESAVYLRG